MVGEDSYRSKQYPVIRSKPAAWVLEDEKGEISFVRAPVSAHSVPADSKE